MELGTAVLRAGANYLSAGKSLVVPTSTGAAILRTTDGATEQTVEAFSAEATILCLSRSPATPELLALASSVGAQVWQLPTRSSSAAPKQLCALDLGGGTCRLLEWHPHRRVLAAALPDKALIFELHGPALHDGPVGHVLPQPENCAGAISACCWGESGSVLACLCEGEVLLYTWALLGASWSHHSCERHPVPNRRLCSILPLISPMSDAADDDDDEDEAADAVASADVFVVGMGVPIATAAAAEISSSEGATRMLTAADAAPSVNRATSANGAAAAAEEVLDLRGQIGGGGGGGGRASLLDLSEELEAARPSAAIRDALGHHRSAGHGALMLCTRPCSGSGGKVELHGGYVDRDAATRSTRAPTIIISSSGRRRHARRRVLFLCSAPRLCVRGHIILHHLTNPRANVCARSARWLPCSRPQL